MNIHYFALVLIIFYSCNDNENDLDCIENQQIDNWITESFKLNYTIQFPTNYEGHGMVGFEGNLFSKFSQDSLIELSYMYCSPLFCEDFGDTLIVPVPNSIIAYDKQNIEVELTEQIEYCSENEISGIFYHNLGNNAVGKLYMKIDGLYLEAVSVFYDIGTQQEVENILKTIKSN